ncbi:MAG: hypothetical protein OEY38_23975, partial [Gammaproteobacteria bacterium]|nr:hypothetical protein [Gammaproteobacteria bacterium]
MKLKFSRFAVFTILFIGGLSPLVAQPFFWQLEGSANPFDQMERRYEVGGLFLVDLDNDSDLDLVIPRTDYSHTPNHFYQYYEN